MRQRLEEWCREHPLVAAIALVATSAGIGCAAAALASGTTREALVVASITLVFGALLGGAAARRGRALDQAMGRSVNSWRLS